MATHNKTYILITPGVPDEVKDVLKNGIPVRRYTLDRFMKEDGTPEGCVVSADELPLPGEFTEGLSEDSVLIWNPDAVNISGGSDGELFLGEIRDFTGPDALVLKLFSENLSRKAGLQKKEAALHNEQEINRELLKVGVALSAERNNDKLLNLILLQIRQLTRSDAGSLYLLVEDEETEEKSLLFKIAHNDSNPTDFTEFKMPLNTSSIAGYVAVTGEILDIPDVYDLDENGAIKFNKSYDEATGYRTKSSLTVPMADHKGNVIGVIQLLNRKRNWDVKLRNPADVDAQVVEFDKHNESIVLSLASQAAVSLENNRLYNEIQTLFEGFVRASVKAIESRDPTTSGHSNRVATLTLKLAEAVSAVQHGEFGSVHFSDEEILELRYASLLHDFGKVGVREAVLVKAKKLYPGQMEIIRGRFHQICSQKRREALQHRFDLLLEKGEEWYRKEEPTLLEEEKQIEEELIALLASVEEANEPRVLEGETGCILEELGKTFFTGCDGDTPYLTSDEIKLLGINRGSLNPEERREIESHVEHSYDFLSQIPWSRDMKNVPGISKSHHEVLTGEGYPAGLSGDEIPLQSQIMTVADIFDALTASDRPYKKAMPRDRAMKILHEEAAAGKINPELLRIFEESGLHEIEL